MTEHPIVEPEPEFTEQGQGVGPLLDREPEQATCSCGYSDHSIECALYEPEQPRWQRDTTTNAAGEREVTGSVTVDGVDYSIVARVTVETPPPGDPHHGAEYLRFRFPTRMVVDRA